MPQVIIIYISDVIWCNILENSLIFVLKKLVLSLPMRNWNENKQMEQKRLQRSFESTYEELKLIY